MALTIYIKGAFDRATQIGCMAFASNHLNHTVTNCFCQRGFDMNRGAYQTELTALINALQLNPAYPCGVAVKSNNKVVVSWLNRINDENCCDESCMDYMARIRQLLKGHEITAEWVPEDDPNEFNEFCNTMACKELDEVINKHSGYEA